MTANVDGCFLDREALGQAIRGQRRAFGVNDFGSGYPIGITQQGLCDYLNQLFDAEINVKKLSRIETGQQEPSFSLIVQIAIVLGGPWWRATLCDFVEASLPGNYSEAVSDADAGGSSITKVVNALASATIDDETDSWRKRSERATELSAQISGALNELVGMLGDMNTALSNPRHAVMRRYSTETEFESLRIEEEIRNRMASGITATPAPTSGAVAIDEPQGKE